MFENLPLFALLFLTTDGVDVSLTIDEKQCKEAAALLVQQRPASKAVCRPVLTEYLDRELEKLLQIGEKSILE